MKVYLTSKACYIVQTETNHIAASLVSNGYQLVNSIPEADSIIITTCAVTDSSAKTNYDGIMECINKRKDNAPIYVVGCYPRIETQRTKELSEYENVIPVPEYKEIEKIFLGSNSWNSVIYNDFFAHPFGNERLKTRMEKISIPKRITRSFLSGLDSIFNKETSFYFHFLNHLYNAEI